MKKNFSIDSGFKQEKGCPGIEENMMHQKYLFLWSDTLRHRILLLVKKENIKKIVS